jgi:bHLH factor
MSHVQHGAQRQADVQRELAAVTAQLADEHTRSLTLEASWRDAEDRAAQNQFELERVKADLENAKMQLLEKRR